MTKIADFLRDFSTFHNRVPMPEQIDYMESVDSAISRKSKKILEMDAGVGKTIGYLIPALFAAEQTKLPVIVATSTIGNRDQIIKQLEMIHAFAVAIKHPIAEIPPPINYRSLHDYCSVARIENLLERLLIANAPESVITELMEILHAASMSEATLIDDVMPGPIMIGDPDFPESMRIYVSRADIAFRLTDKPPEDVMAEREKLKNQLDKGGPCIILVTHAMLAKHRDLRDLVKGNNVAVTIVDEADRLLSLDFLNDLKISLTDLIFVIDELRDNYDIIGVEAASDAVERLLTAIDAVKPHPAAKQDNVMLTKAIVGDSVCTEVFDALDVVITTFKVLRETFSAMERHYTDPDDEYADRIFHYEFITLTGNMELIHDQFLPQYSSEINRLADDSDVRVFVKWEDDTPHLHIFTATPGRAMKWLFAAKIPVILTTAMIATSYPQFAMQLGLGDFDSDGPIRLKTYGKMHFVYYDEMPKPIVNRRLNPAYTTAVADEIVKYYKPGTRMLVLCPGYNDIELLSENLRENSLPVLTQQRGGNIIRLRNALVADPGILLTVLWEGYDIVSHDRSATGRHGVLDTIVITRLPFPQPNSMLQAALVNIHGQDAANLTRSRQMAEVTRRIYQGICRGIRGPNDVCDVLFMDSRMPPPPALLRQNPLLHTKIGYRKLVTAIPDRFVRSARNFSWKEHEGAYHDETAR